MVFKFFFITFAIFFFVQRYLEIKLHKRIQGEIRAAWLTKSLIGAHFLFFFGSLFEFYWPRDSDSNMILSVLGIVIFFAGFFLRRWVIRTLGLFWSIEIEIRKQHELIMNGPYRLCRHPNYLAIILEVIGFCLTANALITLAVSLPLYIFLLVLRIRLEEKELIKTFGSTYKKYMAKTPAIFPFGLNNNVK